MAGVVGCGKEGEIGSLAIHLTLETSMSEQQSQDGVPWWRKGPRNAGRMFLENRSKYPMQELWKYNRRYVAWIPDGSGIHDSDIDPIALAERIRAAGDDPIFYHIEHISDETYL
jgi:hypothetical protein